MGSVEGSNDQRLQEACLKCMQLFQLESEVAKLNPRETSVLMWQLMQLLHCLVAIKRKTLFDATSEDINEWLDPALGLVEHDRRIQLLELLGRNEGLSRLQVGSPRPGEKLRRVKEFLFPGRLHREICRRTCEFFESIKQEDIIAAERGALPLYRAMREFMPSIGEEESDSDEEVLKRLYRLGLNPDKAPAVLDIGCSHGRLLMRIVKDVPHARLTGAELSEWYHGKLMDRGIVPIQSHAGDLDIEDNSQDIVVSTDVIEHLKDPSEMVREIHRVLKPGGVFCVGGPAANSSFINNNPFTYLWIALGNVYEPLLPPFHNLYAPMTPLKIVHYGFTRQQLERLFRPLFPSMKVDMCRFYALKKFRLEGVAPRVPVLRGMGLYVLAFGRKSE